MSAAGVVQEVLSFCSMSCCSLNFSMRADVKEGNFSRLFYKPIVCPQGAEGSNHTVTHCHILVDLNP